MPWTADEDTKLVRAIRKMLARNGGVLPKRAAPDWKKTHRKLGIDHPANQFYIHYNWICWVHKRGLDPRHPVTHAPEIAHRELLGSDFGPHKSWPEGAPTKEVMEAARKTARQEDAWFRPSTAQSEAEDEDESEDEDDQDTAEAPPPPKRTRIKRESAPEAEETKPPIGFEVRKVIIQADRKASTKKRPAEADIEARGRPKRGRESEAEPRDRFKVRKVIIQASRKARTKKRPAEADIEAQGRPKRGRETVAAVLKPKGGMSALKKRS